MNLAFDDFAVFDNTQAVTYQRRDLTGAVTNTYTPVLALKRAVTGGLSGVGQGGQVYADETRWHIQASTLPVTPRRGDRIVSATDGTWEIMTDDVQTNGARYVVGAGRIT